MDNKDEELKEILDELDREMDKAMQLIVSIADRLSNTSYAYEHE